MKPTDQQRFRRACAGSTRSCNGFFLVGLSRCGICRNTYTSSAISGDGPPCLPAPLKQQQTETTRRSLGIDLSAAHFWDVSASLERFFWGVLQVPDYICICIYTKIYVYMLYIYAIRKNYVRIYMYMCVYTGVYIYIYNINISPQKDSFKMLEHTRLTRSAGGGLADGGRMRGPARGGACGPVAADLRTLPRLPREIRCT